MNERTRMHGDFITPFLCFLCFYHHLFLMVSLSEGGGREGRGGEGGGEVLLSDLSVSSAWPRPPQWRHYILLVLLHLATAPQQQSSTATACSVSPMELPLGGPALRHYTQSRPRPHRQKLNYRPSRPQVL